MKKMLVILIVVFVAGFMVHHYYGVSGADLPESEYYTPVSTHYSYDVLTCEEARKVYETIEKNAYKKPDKDSELCSFKGMDETQFYLGYRAFLDDHPDVFWTGMGFTRKGLSFETDRCYVSFRYSREELEEMKGDFREDIEAFLSSVPNGLDQEELEAYTHDYLLNCCEYDYASLNDNGENNEKRRIAGTAYGALRGKAICEGYSRAYQLLLNRVGVECTPVFGRGNAADGDIAKGPVDHAWNAVKKGLSWRMTDVTWDDNGDDPRKYFDLAISEMAMTHDARAIDIDTYSYNMYFKANNDGASLFLPE